MGQAEQTTTREFNNLNESEKVHAILGARYLLYIKGGDLGKNIVVIQKVGNCFAHKN